MSRRKGEITVSRRERAYPHRVLIAVPEGGLGAGVDDIRRLCGLLGVPEVAGRSYRIDNRDHITRCFASREIAEAFAQRFGARVVDEWPN
ncbi:MAG TPA: hypothetical protein PKV67_18490, partial [Hyphomonas sp.]|nr:hypothetical protein [Accumulibacter sp.]HRJ02735.1 hypothetical protein [Hyphomonas sp.]